MIIDSYIQEKKNLVSSYLQTYIKQTVLPEISPVGRWSNDAIIRILTSTLQGKMLRSSFIFLSSQLFSQKQDADTLIKTSAAMELLQTGLLIHDDIMDQDEKRRGKDSIHTQYKKLLKKDGTQNFNETAESFGICAGDIAFFLALPILSEIQPSDRSRKIIALISQEMQKVSASQMHDIYGGNTQKQFSLSDILSLYTYKTGRYSCGLPLALGAIISGAHEQTIHSLWKLGISLGILFQIKDDELNLFGDSKKTGKPIGSDIREGKQTLYYYFLMEKSIDDTQKKLLQSFGNPNLSEENVADIKKQLQDLHIDNDIHAIVKKQEKIADEVIARLPITEDNRNILKSFILYLKKRDA